MLPYAAVTKTVQPESLPAAAPGGKSGGRVSRTRMNAVKQYSYVLDTRRFLFHKQGCVLIDYQSAHVRGFDTMKGCLREMAKPCTCCKREYDECIAGGGRPERRWFYSEKSGRKTVHTADCRMYERIGGEHALYFTSLERAHAEGYRLYSLCNPLLALYNKEKKELEVFCREAGLRIRLYEDTVHIISRNDIWRIMLNQYTGRLMLYHRNNSGYKKKDPGDMSAFHRQEHQEDTLTGYARYIANHDDFADQKQYEAQSKGKDPGYNPPNRNSKKGRRQAKAARNKARNKAISRTLSLIEELAAEGR